MHLHHAVLDPRPDHPQRTSGRQRLGFAGSGVEQSLVQWTLDIFAVEVAVTQICSAVGAPCHADEDPVDRVIDGQFPGSERYGCCVSRLEILDRNQVLPGAFPFQGWWAEVPRRGFNPRIWETMSIWAPR